MSSRSRSNRPHFLWLLSSLLLTTHALQPASPLQDRRNFLATATAATGIGLLGQQPAFADDSDLQSQLYNPDGSVKDDVQKEAKERTLVFDWKTSDTGVVQVDGTIVVGDNNNEGGGDDASSVVKVSYKLPEKWRDGYIDTTEGVNKKALNHVYLYQAPGGLMEEKQLQRASQLGVTKALMVDSSLPPDLAARLAGADLIGGRQVKNNDNDDSASLYEFDMAVAPKTCNENASQNLGLGFCPYDSVYLLSATRFKERLYVLCLECDTAEWKQANADLKRVRSSFRVTA